MFNIKRRKVKAVYHNAFCCPECGLELHMDNIALMTYPAQYGYYCDCGFRTTLSQKPGLEYEFEDEDLPPAFPERIAQIFSPYLENNELDSLKSFVNYIHTTDPAIVENTSYAIDNFTVSTEEAIANIKAVQESFADAMGYSYV